MESSENIASDAFPTTRGIYEKSSSESLSREVSIKEVKNKEQLAPESKKEENLKVNIVGAKNNVCSECRGLSFASSPETRAYVTDVTDKVSLPARSTRIDSILLLFSLNQKSLVD